MARKFSIDSSIATDIMSAASDSFKDNIKMIEITKIKPSMDNFYSISDIEMLADDIEREGLKHNLVVVEDIDNPDTFFIKSGHRRFTAVTQLVNEGRYSSKYVPCLVDGKKSIEETRLDLIMLNATTRVMTDAERVKQYDVLKETLDNMKENGIKLKGRFRERAAELLNVSPAQIGKIENIKHNAIEEVQTAVANGDISIAVADSIATLDVAEQKEIVNDSELSKIKTADVKKKKKKAEKEEQDSISDSASHDNDEAIPEIESVVSESTDEVEDVSIIDTEPDLDIPNFTFDDDNSDVEEYRRSLINKCNGFIKKLERADSDSEINRIVVDMKEALTDILTEVNEL